MGIQPDGVVRLIQGGKSVRKKFPVSPMKQTLHLREK
jgi:hypothetical protein